MKIKDGWLHLEWEVSDGYCSGRRTHTAQISVGDILECENESEISELISDTIQEDFEQKVSWSFGTESAVTKILGKLAPDGWTNRPEEYDGGDAKIV